MSRHPTDPEIKKTADSWVRSVPRSSASSSDFKAVRPEDGTVEKRIASELEGRIIDRQMTDAWNSMGAHMIAVIRSIQKSERWIRRMVYTVLAAVAFLAGLTVYTSWDASEKRAAMRADVLQLRADLRRTDENVSAMLKVIGKSAEATAKNVENTSADPEAVKAAVDVQEEAARAQIQIAASREEPPPPDATKKLEGAIQKKAELEAKDASQ